MSSPTHTNTSSGGSPSEGEEELMSSEQGSNSVTRRSSPSVPRTKPTTVADRVASRLVAQLESCPELVKVFQMGYLKYLPPLLSRSPSLRDTVSLFCTAWAGYRRQQPVGDFMSMEAYGKALRSLRRCLDGDKAYSSMETLAAITLLERSEALFDRERKPFQISHTEGILWLIQRQGPPSQEDKLYSGLIFDNMAGLITYWFAKDGHNFLVDSPWREAMEDTAAEFLEPAIKQSAMAAVSFTSTLYARWPRYLRSAQTIFTDPCPNQELQLFTIAFINELSEAEVEARFIFGEVMSKAFELGEIRELPDPAAISGRSYHLTAVFFGQSLLELLSLRLALLRMLYELTVLRDPAQALIYGAEYRALCLETWKFIPFVYGLDPLIATWSFTPFTLAFEGAEGFEREYLLKMIVEVDSYRQSFPRDHDILASTLVHHAMMLTGRLPMALI
ncbi:unnamed protein product [Clonostachys rosea]|uniref:Transcription factor domain-containing protein n=1 Tax=Bionectria ochroleuca TaxID=29856 RepID=A0ABY6V0K7_BIOOC|nr:unnamed protein product [Clonostachys rosea]